MTEKIKMLMIKTGINQCELSAKLGVAQPTLSKKFKLDDWRESDLNKIAKACGATYQGNFYIDNDKI